MKSKTSILLCLVLVATIGIFAVDALSAQGEADATAPAAARYQISAYAGTTGGSVHHGCYVVDTATGQLWHAHAGGKAEKLDKLQ
jgi:hypothetical protein